MATCADNPMTFTLMESLAKASMVLWMSPGSEVNKAPKMMRISLEFLASAPKFCISKHRAISNEFWSEGSPLGSNALCCRALSWRSLSKWYCGDPLTSATKCEMPFLINTMPSWEMGFWSKNSVTKFWSNRRVMAKRLGRKSFSSMIREPSTMTIRVRMMPRWYGVVGFLRIFFFALSIIVWMTDSSDAPASSSLTMSHDRWYSSSHEYPPFWPLSFGPIAPAEAACVFSLARGPSSKSASDPRDSGDPPGATYSSSEFMKVRLAGSILVRSYLNKR